ncbi:MAG: hypothetical protein ACQEP0_11110 [Natrinema limicola]
MYTLGVLDWSILVMGALFVGTHVLIARMLGDPAPRWSRRLFRYGFPCAAILTLLGLSSVSVTIGQFEPYRWGGVAVDATLVRTVSASLVLFGIVSTTVVLAVVVIASSDRYGEKTLQDDA